jgi:hypothetical protein
LLLQKCEKVKRDDTLAVKIFGLGNLFMTYNAKGGNKGERVATPISISIFDSYDMKSL